MAKLLDRFAHGRHVDDLEYGVDVLLVDLPDEGDLGRQRVQWPEVDIGRAVAKDEGLVVRQALVVVGRFGGGFNVGLLRLLVGEVLRHLAQFVELRPVNIPPGFSRTSGLTSSLMDDHSELLTYRVTPFSFSTSRPNCLCTSGEPFPNESASETAADVGLVASLAGPTTGEPWPGLPVPTLAI